MGTWHLQSARVSPRCFLQVEPFGGGAALQSTILGTCNGGVVAPAIPSALVDISAVADQPIRIKVLLAKTSGAPTNPNWSTTIDSVDMVY